MIGNQNRSSFDHVVTGPLKRVRRLQADREAKYKYGRNRPHEQLPQHQGGAGALEPEKDVEADDEESASVDLVEGGLPRRLRSTTMWLNSSLTPHRSSGTSSNPGSSSTSSSRI